ncbi:MAG: hypothetical protein GY835_14245 [bacterium]|nr:hypothetical protein [bacterium]
MRLPLLCLALILTVGAAVAADDNAVPRERLHLPPSDIDEAPAGDRLDRSPPLGVEIVNPAEFCRAEAMIIYWTNWHSRELCDMCVAVADDHNVIVCVSSESQQVQANNAFATAGVNLANIEYFQTTDGSVWIRDYGPFCIYEDGALAISDFCYGGSISDGVDAIPVYLAQDRGLDWYRSPVTHHGGNHITDGNGLGFFSTNLTNLNSDYDWPELTREMNDYLGLDSLVVFDTLAGDLTGHCDMYVKMLNDTLFIVGEYAEPGDAVGNDYDYLNWLATDLDGRRNLDGRDFEVVRIPMNPIYSTSFPINRSYTNSLILNDKVLVPIYNTELDAPALQIYADCMPGYEIIGIDSEAVIEYLGAIHCITNTLHHENPLVFLHEALASTAEGTAPVVSCRLNPRFADREVDLFIRTAPGGPFTTIPAEFVQGVWHAQMPSVYLDFDYYFEARVTTDAGEMMTRLPATAPLDYFTVAVEDMTGLAEVTAPARPLTAWPNPCNPTVTIGFSLAHESAATLCIYDVMGRRRATLLDAPSLPAGRREVRWSGDDDNGGALPSGVYLARLEAGGRVEQQRIVLLK